MLLAPQQCLNGRFHVSPLWTAAVTSWRCGAAAPLVQKPQDSSVTQSGVWCRTTTVSLDTKQSLLTSRRLLSRPLVAAALGERPLPCACTERLCETTHGLIDRGGDERVASSKEETYGRERRADGRPPQKPLVNS